MLKFRNAVIAAVGCGGTGSYLTDHLGRLLGYNGVLRNLNHTLLINIDADIISTSNTVRQNFSYRDINEQKGLVLQRKLIQQYNVRNVDFWASYANKRLLERLFRKVGDLPLIILSCVDNHRTRNRIMSFLKPDPDSWANVRQQDWLYLDAGNNIIDGWTSAMSFCGGQGYGVDMRQQDINMRNNNIDQAPTVGDDGRQQQGCGAASSSPRTYFGNQTNAMLMARQLKTICEHGRGYGVQAWQAPDIEADTWQTEAYQNHFLAPFEIP